jgi:DNA-binding HxlR family transcriptional regulator
MQCPVHGLLTLLSGSWTTYILWLLQEKDELRFGELLRQMPGLSAKVLTERLRKLEEAGLLSRHPEPTIPPKVTYRLTDRGRELYEPLQRLGELATRWGGDDGKCPKLALQHATVQPAL